MGAFLGRWGKVEKDNDWKNCTDIGAVMVNSDATIAF
jgi:hypothetical protein